ncbi:MAG: TonB-dependent receptor [FCB group bacterium]|nr:TonB-dependent receptor [FCB group bacterium]
MKAGLYILALTAAFLLAMTVFPAAEPIPPADSLLVDTTGETAVPFPLPPGDSIAGGDSLGLYDSLALTDQPEPLPPPIRMLDSLTGYFCAQVHNFDVNQYDLYPRNAAGFLKSETSYFTETYSEWPFRTTVAPFGLTAGQLNVQAGAYEIRPYDRVIPADGKIDFDDIRTGDIVSARLLEGPLSAFASPGGGLAMLYLEPMPLPEDMARSEFTVERGSYGYAYTRARIGRMFNPDFGLSVTTDYRTADGLNPVADDDMYNLNGRMIKRQGRKTTFEFYLNAYHREGGFPVEPDSGGFTFQRDRRDHHFVASATRQEILGGQLAGIYQLQMGRTDYSRSGNSFYRVIKPRRDIFDAVYTRPQAGAVYEISFRVGREQYDLNQLDESRLFGHTTLAGQFDRFGARWFVFGRTGMAEDDQTIFEGVAGLSANLSPQWKTVFSIGLTGRRPDLADLYADERGDVIGSTGSLSGFYREHGNPDLEAEKRLTGNASVAYCAERASFSVAFNAGRLDDLIYYDRLYGDNSGLEVFPDNDDGTFADLNISGSFDRLGPFFGLVSLSGRRVDTDRWGDRPPYSPRWQVYGQLGLRHFVARYKIKLRLFADIAYTEKPLSYKMEELETTALVTAGFNAALKDLTFYYKIDNLLNQFHFQPQGYGYAGWHYSWGVNWKFFD